MANVEIERKFLVKKLPDDLMSYRHHEIEQGYLCKEPVVRIRKSDDDYYLTYKDKGLMERAEYNLPLSKEGYEHLKKKIDGHLIKKTRYIIPLDSDLNIELDVFAYPENLILAEVEFPSIEMANNFHMPDWFKEDVTLDKRYHNVNMIDY